MRIWINQIKSSQSHEILTQRHHLKCSNWHLTLELSEVPGPSVLWRNLTNPADGQLSGLPFRWEGPDSPSWTGSSDPHLCASTKFFWESDSVPVEWEKEVDREEQLGSQEWRDSGGMGGGRSGGGGGGGSLWGGGGAGRGLSCFLDMPGEDYRGKERWWLTEWEGYINN